MRYAVWTAVLAGAIAIGATCAFGCSAPKGDADKTDATSGKDAAPIPKNLKPLQSAALNQLKKPGEEGDKKLARSSEIYNRKPLTPEEIAQKFPDGKIPVIAADNATFDFGKVNEGRSADHVFILKNNGKGLLHIDEARGS